MHCTHCHKELTHIGSANCWPLLSGANALWPRSSALSIPNHATRLLGSYASLWNRHQPIRDLLTNLSRHSNTRARVNEGYEVNFYSASELVSRCRTVVEKLSQTQSSCDLGSSFVICLKQDRAATYCLSDFLGAAAFSRNSITVATMHTNPLYFETNLPHFLPRESTIDHPDYFVPMADESFSDDPEYMVAMPAAASHYSQQSPFTIEATRTWPNYDTRDARLGGAQRQWPANYETTLSAQAPNVQTQEPYYSIPMELQTTRGLFEKLAQEYEQFMVVFVHQPVQVCEHNYSEIAGVVYEMESLRVRAAPSYFQQAKNFLWRNTQRRVTTVLVTTVIIGGIVGAYLGLTHSTASASASSENSRDRDCTYPAGVNTTFTELQETLAAGNSSLRIPGLDPATCTLISMVINNTVSALKTGGYHCWQNVQSALMPLASSALALNADSLQQIIASVKQYCFPSTSTGATDATSTTSRTTTTPANTLTTVTTTPTTSTPTTITNTTTTTAAGTTAMATQLSTASTVTSTVTSTAPSTIQTSTASLVTTSTGTTTTLAPSTSTTIPAGTTTVTTLAPTTSTTLFVSTSTPTTLQTSTSTSTPVTTTTLSTTTTSKTTTPYVPCCQLNTCLPYPFQNCRCDAHTSRLCTWGCLFLCDGCTFCLG